MTLLLLQAALLLAIVASAFAAWAGLAPLSWLPVRAASWSMGACITVAMGSCSAYVVLTLAFAQNDFSVAYVAENSSLTLPLGYRLTALWGEHAGSLLLWAMLLGATAAAVATRRDWPFHLRRGAAGLLAALAALLTVVLWSTTTLLAPSPPGLAGSGSLNPLLQDPAMASHPPLLYLGYTGLSVPFALAFAALWHQDATANWLAAGRPWLLGGWVALTASLVAGSWWSHYELGWGGWWFWDPTENAALIPWLVATALIHATAVAVATNLWVGWAQLLAIAGFGASILGILLGRIGAFSSVHTFANDAESAAWTLYPMLGILVLSTVLWIRRRAGTRGHVRHPLTRESVLLLGSALLGLVATLVALGTVYPSLTSAVGLPPVGVGPPYFNVVFLGPMTAGVVLAGVAMHTAWGVAPQWSTRSSRWLGLGLPGLACAIAVPWLAMGRPSFLASTGLLAASWVTLSAAGAARTARGRVTRFAMHLAHVGAGISLLGIAFASAYGVASDYRAKPDEPLAFEGYAIAFRGTRIDRGPNYLATRGTFDVRPLAGDLPTVTVTSEKRDYQDRRAWLTEAGIWSSWRRDLLIQLGEPLGDGTWSVRFQYRPLVRWIWAGGGLMAIGGVLAALGRRFAAHASSGAVNARLGADTGK